jgi:Spy/CpxP family protein refolding chaperone
MKNNRKLMAATAILAMLALAAPAYAWMGDWSGTRVGRGMEPATGAQALTTEQQKKVDETQGKYQPQLQELQQKLNAKQAELIAARNDDGTTVGQINALEGELYNLERTYWTELDQANLEMSRVAGGGYGSWFACDYQGCDHSNGRHSMMRAGYAMSDRSMSDGHYGSCCW